MVILRARLRCPRAIATASALACLVFALAANPRLIAQRAGLYDAAQDGTSQQVLARIARGANPNQPNDDGETPIMIADTPNQRICTVTFYLKE